MGQRCYKHPGPWNPLIGVSPMSTVPRKRRASKTPATFRITFTIGDDVYFVTPLPVHPEVASKAYRFWKQTGEQEVYDVRLADFGPECDCKGFLRWQKPCKHVRTLRAAGMLPADSCPATER